jgi:hypothetical protein
MRSLVPFLLFLVSACVLSTTAKKIMNNEVKRFRDVELTPDKLVSNVEPTPQLPDINSRMGDMPIPRRPPGFSIGPSDAGILIHPFGNRANL